MIARALRISCLVVLAGAVALAGAAPAQANPIPLFPIKTMVVTFNSGLAERFALDNLAFGISGLEDMLVFDEVPRQPVDGLTVTTASGNSVTFGFELGGLPSTDALYNSTGPGALTYVEDPSLEGSTLGVLTVEFGTPASFIYFGLALSTFEPGIGATVRLLLEDGTDLATIQRFDDLVDIEPLVSFSEGRFAIPSAPEPASVALFGVGLLACALWVRRRRSRS